MNIIFYFELHRLARKKNDRLAALFSIIRAGDIAQKLGDLFGGVEEAIDKVMYRDPTFSWPAVPEGYQIPQQLLMAVVDKLKSMTVFGMEANRDVLMFWENAAGRIEVMEKDSVDVIRKIFIELAESIGVLSKEMREKTDENDRFEWCIDYGCSLGEQLRGDLDELLLFFEVHRIAIQKNDRVAAYIALLYCGIYSQNVSGFFLNIKEEVNRVAVVDKRFSWPTIPEEYQLPEALISRCIDNFEWQLLRSECLTSICRNGN